MKISNTNISRFFSSQKPKEKELREEKRVEDLQHSNARKAMKYLTLAADAKVVRQRISDINLDHLARILRECEASPAIKSLLDAIIYVKPNSSSLPLKYNIDYIKSAITNLRRNDFGYTASLFKIEDALLFKDLTGDPELRALIISNFGLNNLRDLCPNFRYFYGFLNIDEIISRGSRVESWLPNPEEGKYTLMIWENVEMNRHAQSLATALRSMTREQFLNVYLQMLYALRLADNFYEFTHYNLIPENVYLIDTKETAIRYSTEHGHEEYLETTHFAKMIDYRKAHARVKINEGHYHFGTTGLSTFQTHGFPLQDAYMLLMNCMVLAKGFDNTILLDTGRRLHQFFNGEDSLESALYTQKKYGYHLPYSKETKLWSLDSYLSYIREIFPCRFMKRVTNLPIYGEPRQSNLTRLGLLKDPMPVELLDFYDLYLQSENPRRIQERYDYYTGIRDHMGNTRKIMERSQDIFGTLEVIPVAQDQFIRDVYALFNAYDYFIMARYYVTSAMSVADIFNDPVSKEKIKEEFEEFRREVVPLIEKWNVELYKRVGNTYIYQFWAKLVS